MTDKRDAFVLCSDIRWHCLRCGRAQLSSRMVLAAANFKVINCLGCGHPNPIDYFPVVVEAGSEREGPPRPCASDLDDLRGGHPRDD